MYTETEGGADDDGEHRSIYAEQHQNPQQCGHDLLRPFKCDIALVPVGGTYTMDARKAAELVNRIRPSVAIPVHYGSIVGKREDAEVFAEYVERSVKTEIKLRFEES